MIMESAEKQVELSLLRISGTAVGQHHHYNSSAILLHYDKDDDMKKRRNESVYSSTDSFEHKTSPLSLAKIWKNSILKHQII